MYIEQLTHEDFTQTTRSAPVTAVCTWTFPCRPVDTSARSWENMFQSMPRLSRTFSAVLRCGAMMDLTHTMPDSCISTRSDRLLMDLASALFSLMRRMLMTWALQSGSASLSSVAIIIVEHRRGLAEVAPARFRMDLFRSTTVGQKRSRDQKFCSCHGRLGTPLNVADRSLQSVIFH